MSLERKTNLASPFNFFLEWLIHSAELSKDLLLCLKKLLSTEAHIQLSAPPKLH